MSAQLIWSVVPTLGKFVERPLLFWPQTASVSEALRSRLIVPLSAGLASAGLARLVTQSAALIPSLAPSPVTFPCKSPT